MSGTRAFGRAITLAAFLAASGQAMAAPENAGPVATPTIGQVSPTALYFRSGTVDAARRSGGWGSSPGSPAGS